MSLSKNVTTYPTGGVNCYSPGAHCYILHFEILLPKINKEPTVRVMINMFYNIMFIVTKYNYTIFRFMSIYTDAVLLNTN